VIALIVEIPNFEKHWLKALFGQKATRHSTGHSPRKASSFFPKYPPEISCRLAYFQVACYLRPVGPDRLSSKCLFLNVQQTIMAVHYWQSSVAEVVSASSLRDHQAVCQQCHQNPGGISWRLPQILTLEMT
jgi:hypothetical protein